MRFSLARAAVASRSLRCALVVLGMSMFAPVQRAHADDATKFTLSAELGAAALTGHPSYVFGTGTTIGLGISLYDRLSFEWTSSQYSMRAKDDLDAANTLGRLKANAVVARLRLPLLPVTVGGGIGQINAPLLTKNEDGAVTTSGVRQTGAVVSGALLFVRSRKVSIYAEGRLFVPLFKEIPPEHYPDQSESELFPSTESKSYPMMALGLGMRISL